MALSCHHFLKGLRHGTFVVFSSKLHKYNSLLPLLVGIIYFFEHEKKIGDKCLRKDLSKVDSGPKTRSVQSEKSCNPSPSLPSMTMGDSKQSQGCSIVSGKQTE